jgi:hypothetical protein
MRDGSLCLGMMAWPSGEPAIAQAIQIAAQRLSGDADPELLPQPLAEIDQTPAHDAMDGRDRTALDGGRQRRAMVVVQPRLRTRRLAIDQTIRSCLVESAAPSPG